MPLIKQCLRWCSPTAIEQHQGPAATDEATDESIIDWFVDKHLHYLPFPRFTRAFNEANTLEDLVDNVCLSLIGFAHLCEVDLETDASSDLYYIAEKFNELCPTLPTLRQTNLPLKNLKCALALLALDPIEFAKISANTLHYEIFPQLALKMTARDIGRETSLETLLQDVDLFLEKQKLDSAYKCLPDANEWPTRIAWLTARDNMMANVPSLEPYSEMSGLSMETLEKCAFVKNIVDEEIQVGFDRPL